MIGRGRALVKSRSLGLIFIAAVILPSSLLGLLSIRSTGREEAFIEKDRATTLDGEVTHAVDLANAELQSAVKELRSSIFIPADAAPSRLFKAWKAGHPLVSVPFLLSPRYGVLWPLSNAAASSEEKRFLKENGDFLSDKTTTAVLQNIAVRYQAEILAQAGEESVKTDKAKDTAPQKAAPSSRAFAAASTSAPAGMRSEISAEAGASTADREAVADTAAVAAPSPAPAAEKLSRQVALDAFAQSPAVQKMVYAEAQSNGDTVNARVVEPAAAAQSETVSATTQKQPSQYVVTSQLLSQIASQGDAGIIPRFIGEKLVFLFWSRQADGRIAGCEVSTAALRSRVGGIITSTYTPLRILTLLDENGSPLATPPDVTGINWHQPFVAREIGESLPRWEAAAYLSDPNAKIGRASCRERV